MTGTRRRTRQGRPPLRIPRHTGSVLLGLVLALAVLVLGPARPASAAPAPQAPATVPSLLPADEDCSSGNRPIIEIIEFEDDPQCLAENHDNYGDDVSEGCDGWGEPAGYCVGVKDGLGSEPTWWKDLPKWAEWQVYTFAANVFGWWANAPDPSLRTEKGEDRPSMGFIFKYTNIFVIFMLFLGVLFAAVRMALARDGKPAKEVFKALVSFTLITGLIVTIAEILIRLCRRFFDWYVTRGMSSDAGTDAPAAIAKGTRIYLTSLNSSDGFALRDIIAGIIVVCVAIVLYIYMVARFFLIIYYVATMPLMAAAATVGEAGKHALKRQITLLFIWIVVLDFMGMALVLGFQEVTAAQRVEANDGSAAWRGLILFAMVTLVLPATLKAAAPFLEGAAGSSAATVGAAKAGLAVGAAAVLAPAALAIKGGAAFSAARGAGGVAAGGGGGGAGGGGGPGGWRRFIDIDRSGQVGTRPWRYRGAAAPGGGRPGAGPGGRGPGEGGRWRRRAAATRARAGVAAPGDPGTAVHAAPDSSGRGSGVGSGPGDELGGGYLPGGDGSGPGDSGGADGTGPTGTDGGAMNTPDVAAPLPGTTDEPYDPHGSPGYAALAIDATEKQLRYMSLMEQDRNNPVQGGDLGARLTEETRRSEAISNAHAAARTASTRSDAARGAALRDARTAGPEHHARAERQVARVERYAQDRSRNLVENPVSPAEAALAERRAGGISGEGSNLTNLLDGSGPGGTRPVPPPSS